MPQSLLDKAKTKSRAGRAGIESSTKEEIDLAVAWAKGDITLTQAMHAHGINKANATIYTRLAFALAAYVRREEGHE